MDLLLSVSGLHVRLDRLALIVAHFVAVLILASAADERHVLNEELSDVVALSSVLLNEHLADSGLRHVETDVPAEVCLGPLPRILSHAERAMQGGAGVVRIEHIFRCASVE